MKRTALLLIVLLFLSYSIAGDNEYVEVLNLEEEAFGIVGTYGELLRGTGYAFDNDFDYARDKYREFVLNGSNNPFIYIAYGFTFHYSDIVDSAAYYFRQANDMSHESSVQYMRLVELYRTNGADYIIDETLDNLIGLKYKLGAVTLAEAALYLNAAAVEEYNDKGNVEKAEQFLIYANSADPFNMTVIANLAKLSLREMRFENTSYMFKMLRVSLLDIFNKFMLLFNMIVFFRYLVFSVFIIMTLILFIKNAKAIHHAIIENLTKKLTRLQKNIIFIVILVLPLIFQLHPILWVFYLSIINFCFIRRREKIVMGILMIFIAVMPLMFNVENHIQGKMSTDDNMAIIVNANYSFYDANLVASIDSMITEQPFNNALFFAKAILYKKGGYFDRAEEEYSKIVLTGEKSGEVYNNLGNLMFFMKMYQKAEEYYEKAMKISPKLPQPYYNMAQLQINKLNLNESNRYMEKASALNNDLINNVMDNTVEGYHNTELIDCTIPERYLWDEFTKRSSIRSVPVIMGVRMHIIMLAALISLILSGIIGSSLKHRMNIEFCYTCGRPLFRKNMKEYNEQKVCSQCFNTMDSTISDSLRARKYESLVRVKDKSRKKLIWIMSMIFPGAGSIVSERLAKGFITVLISAGFIILFFSREIFIVRVPYIASAIELNNNYFIAGILLLIYIINVSVARKSK